MSETQQRNNFVARHWRGEFPLWTSYWVFGFLTNIALLMLISAVTAILTKDEFVPWKILLTLTLIWLGACLAIVWQTVGVWRSATRYSAERNGQKKAVWGGIAKLFIALGVIREPLI